MPQKFIKQPMTSARDRIVLSAWDLFHEKGLDGTSVDEILKQSDTGKSQFYHYFGSKDGLVHAMLEEARRMIKDGDIEGIQPIETWTDLKDYFEHLIIKMEYYEYCRACPLGRFIAEMSQEDEAIRKDILLIFETKKQYPKEFFIKMQAKGELKENADPESLANFSESVLQGAAMLSKMHRDPEPLRHAIDHAYEYLLSFKK